MQIFYFYSWKWRCVAYYCCLSSYCLGLCCISFWTCSFNIKYKNLVIENNNIEIYAGFATHYIKVNGKIKDEYKASFTFTPIILSCCINKHKLQATISTSNHIVVKIDEELIR